MRKPFARVFALCCVALVVAPVGSQQPRPASGPPRPNVILIMTDDMGYADLGSYGATDIRTPNIDSLATAGVRLTDAYANGVLCSPTRAALISGRYPQRYAIEHALGPEGTAGLAAAPTSLPQVLKGSGYRTALIGKWHLGGSVTQDVKTGEPRAHGFDYFFGADGQSCRLLAPQSRTEAGGSLGERNEDRSRRSVPDDAHHRAVGEVRRGERGGGTALLPRRRLQRAALAVPAAGPAVDGA